jgi:2-succinyl-6-hydroxy-2,4-cyclohexadiene-1-carboxylate synthase
MTRFLVDGVAFHVEIAGTGAPLVLLHGFTGSGESWAQHIPVLSQHFLTVAIDLLGHGRTESPADPRWYRIERAAGNILAVLDHLGLTRAAVLGYSMGGRLALFLAARAPERVSALILESATPGIRDPDERRARAAQDLALADSIERDGITAFVDRWERLPLFATQTRLTGTERAALRTQRLAQCPRGLANSLRAMGQGEQPPLFDDLPSLSMRVLIVVGAMDTAYCLLGREIARVTPHARLVIVPDAGHAVHLERPEEFRRTVLEFLAAPGVSGRDSNEADGRPDANASGEFAGEVT